MAITPQDIEQQTFSPSKHGYDTEEVDAFLEKLSEEVDSMLQKIADLKGRLTETEEELADARTRLEEAPSSEALATVEGETVYVEPADYSATERQISQVLIVAQQSADKLLEDANASAEQIRSDADAKAREVIRQALAEKQNELDEIDRLRKSREDFRLEYKTLLQRFMDDADAVFPQQSLVNGSAAAASSYVATPAPAPASDVVVDTGDFGDLD